MTSANYILAAFTNIHLKPFDIPKLRGYFASKYREEPLFHNHSEDGASYQYPRIQYRVYHGHPALIGIGEGMDIVRRIILDNHDIRIGDKNMTVREIQVEVFKEDFGQTESFQDYRFASPWMALNQDNYKEYIKMNTMDQKKLLKKILRGNLMTLSKAFSYTIPDFDSVEVDGWFKTVSRNFHNIPMHCFTGEFSTNFLIPDHLALGKQVSRGFGVVQRQKEIR